MPEAFCFAAPDAGAALTLADLAKRNACFAGFGTDASWRVPIGALVAAGGMRPAGNASNAIYTGDRNAVVEHFGDVCAPGFLPYAPKLTGGKDGGLCQLCGDPAAHACDRADSYYGDGATACPGDVLFTLYPPAAPGGGAAPAQAAPAAPTPAAVPAAEPAAVPAAVPDAVPDANPEMAIDPVTGLPLEPPNPPKPPKPLKAPKPPKAPEAAVDPATGLPLDAAAAPIDAAALIDPAAAASAAPADPAAGRRRLAQAAAVAAGFAGKSLLCPSRPGCQPVADYESCNLARVPTQAFVAAPAFADAPLGAAAAAALVKAGADASFLAQGQTFGVDPFLLITPGTEALALVAGSTSDFLGPEFARYMAAGERVIAAAQGGGDDGGSGLSTAAIVGIVCACVVVGGGLITLAAVAILRSREQKTGWQRYQSEVRNIQKI